MWLWPLSGGSSGGSRYVLSGAGDVPLAVGESAAPGVPVLYALTLAWVCCGEWKLIFNGVLVRVFLCPAE